MRTRQIDEEGTKFRGAKICKPALAGEPAKFVENDSAQSECGRRMLPNFAVEKPAFTAAGQFPDRKRAGYFSRRKR